MSTVRRREVLSNPVVNYDNPSFDQNAEAHDQMESADVDIKEINASRNIGADEISKVSFFHLFRFASKRDRMMMMIGVLAAVLSGVCWPINMIVYGDLTDAFVKYSKNESDSHHCNSTS